MSQPQNCWELRNRPFLLIITNISNLCTAINKYFFCIAYRDSLKFVEYHFEIFRIKALQNYSQLKIVVVRSYFNNCLCNCNFRGSIKKNCKLFSTFKSVYHNNDLQGFLFSNFVKSLQMHDYWRICPFYHWNYLCYSSSVWK